LSTLGTVRSGSNDGSISKYDSTSYATTWGAASGGGTSGTPNVGQQYPFATDKYRIDRAVVQFDLSSLGVTLNVFAASITITCSNDYSTTDFTIRMVDGSDAEDTLHVNDYGDLRASTTTVASNTITTNTWTGTKTFNLNAAGVALLQGSTSTLKKFCLRSEEDINESVPTDAERVLFLGGSTPTETNRPLLTLTYNVLTGDAPTVSIETCVSVAGLTATGRGRIEDLGSSAVTAFGHCWATKTTVDARNGTPPTTADSSVDNKNGVVAVGNFTSAITGLTAMSQYLVRVWATNTTGTSYSHTIALRAGDPTTQMIPGNLAIVEDGLQCVDAYGNKRVIKGSIVT